MPKQCRTASIILSNEDWPALPKPAKLAPIEEMSKIPTIIGHRSNCSSSSTATSMAVTEPPPSRLSRPRATVIGSSIVRGTGKYITSPQIDSCVYVNPGAKVADITEKVLTQCSLRDDAIVISCGGNDAATSSVSNIIHDYDYLLDTLTGYCPDAHIVVSSVTPRSSPTINKRINQLNSYLQGKCLSIPEKLTFMDSNITHSHLRRDGVHLTHDGTHRLGSNINNAIVGALDMTSLS